MKKFLCLCLLFTLSLACPFSLAAETRSPATLQSVDHGVGFSLALDYGYFMASTFRSPGREANFLARTCSIYFANGSAVDVAKIEGSPNYKAIMHHIETTSEVHHPGTPEALDFLLQQLQHYLPSAPLTSALSHWPHQDRDTNVVKAMLLALKSAAEAYLESPAPVADLVVPMTISERGRQIFESASSSAGFRRVTGFPVAGSLAAMANGICPFYQHPEKCPYDDDRPGQLILTVDYSRAALTAILYLEEMCVFDILRERHDVNLGADALSQCQPRETDDGSYRALTEALSEVVKMPVERVEPDVPQTVAGLVLLGERGTEPHLRRALQHVLAEQNIFIVSGDDGYSLVDPTFAAAQGIAAASWGNQNRPD